MKKLIGIILMGFVAFMSVSSADVGLFGRSTTLSGSGTVKAGSQEKFFVNCKNTSGGTIADGDVMILDVANDDGYSCTTSTTPGAVPHCIMAESCVDEKMCKCQTYGIKTNVNFDQTDAAATAGEQVFISESNAGKVQAEVKASIAASDVSVGVFYDSDTASGDIEVFIRLRK